jgi:hypothetical protein
MRGCKVLFCTILLTAVSQYSLKSGFASESDAVIKWNANAGVPLQKPACRRSTSTIRSMNRACTR